MNFKHLSLALVACTLSAGTTALADTHTEDLPNFHRISNFMSTGDSPSLKGTEILQKQHFGAVVDLRAPSPATVDEKRAVEKLEMNYVGLPVGNGVPTELQVTQFIQTVEHAPRQIGWYPAVYVHGDKGTGATGCLIAIWHITHDHWPYKRAMTDARKYGLDDNSTALAALVKDYADGTKKLSKPATSDVQ